MGVRILTGKVDGTKNVAFWYDSVTELVFGPAFNSEEEAEEFFQSFFARKGDPRDFTEDQIRTSLHEWRASKEM